MVRPFTTGAPVMLPRLRAWLMASAFMAMVVVSGRM
jgi:hypothetical protein